MIGTIQARLLGGLFLQLRQCEQRRIVALEDDSRIQSKVFVF